MASIASASPSLHCHFEVVDQDCRDLPAVGRMIGKTMSHSREELQQFVEKIGPELTCEVLKQGDIVMGVIVYGKRLVEGSLDLRALCYESPTESLGRIYGESLIHRVHRVAKQKLTEIVQLPDGDEKTAALFQKYGCGIINQEKKSLPPTDGSSDRVDQPQPQAKKFCPAAPNPKETASTSKQRKEPPAPIASASSSRGSAPRRGMVEHQLKVNNNAVIDAIRSGDKTYEAELDTSNVQHYQVGDRIRWTSEQKESVVTAIIHQERCSNFEELITQKIDYRSLMPNAESPEDALAVYHQRKGSPQKALHHGVIAWQFQVVADTATESASTKSRSHPHHGPERRKSLRRRQGPSQD